MARRKVIITVAQTGAFHGKEANPNIPLTPEEIAASAYDCYNAGAAIIHIHARDQEGLSTNDPKVYSAIGSGIRARGNAILQYSTAPANREGTCAEDGMRLLYDPDLVKPEMCSLDCSLIGTSWGDRTFVYEWYRPFLLKYARKMRDMGITPERGGRVQCTGTSRRAGGARLTLLCHGYGPHQPGLHLLLRGEPGLHDQEAA